MAATVSSPRIVASKDQHSEEVVGWPSTKHRGGRGIMILWKCSYVLFVLEFTLGKIMVLEAFWHFLHFWPYSLTIDLENLISSWSCPNASFLKRAFKSKHPFWVIVLTSYCVTDRHRLPFVKLSFATAKKIYIHFLYIQILNFLSSKISSLNNVPRHRC